MKKKKNIALNVSKSDSKMIEVQENIKKLHSIDKSLIPQYLDNLKVKLNKPGKTAKSNDEFLKYM